MKLIFKNIIAIVLLTTVATAQWYQQTSNTNVRFQSIFFIDINTGWVCGDGGRILNTSNGGLNWTKQSSNTTVNLNKIQFIDTNNGWACGGNQILKTTEGGLTWSVQTLPSSTEIHAIQFVNPDTGWLISAKTGISSIYKSSDGGISWNLQSQSQTEFYHSLFFLDELNGWVAFSVGGLLKTTDGGRSWNQYPANIGGGPMDIMFINNMVGWISQNTLGSYGIIKTTDGGETWFSQITGGLNTFISSISFTDSYTGYAAGWQMFIPPTPDQEFIMKTTDGGASWTEQYKEGGGLYSVFFINDTVGWAAGSGGKILATVNGGVTEVTDNNLKTPIHFILYQNYPNPFNPTTTISFQIPAVGFVTLKVFDVLGNDISILVNEEILEGTYENEFKAVGIPSGIYFYQLKIDSYMETKKMLYLK